MLCRRCFPLGQATVELSDPNQPVSKRQMFPHSRHHQTEGAAALLLYDSSDNRISLNKRMFPDKTGLKLVYLPEQEAVSMSFLRENGHPPQIPSAPQWTHTDLNAISMPFQSPACRNYLQIRKDSSLMERVHVPKLQGQMPTTLPTNQDQHWPQMGGRGEGKPLCQSPTHSHSRYLIDGI